MSNNTNTGHRNTGSRNTGDFNTGYFNTGSFNTGDHHVGCFNTISAKKAYYFNKLIDKSLWDEADKPDWLFKPSPATWVSSDDMTEAEKANNPSHETTKGYLRVNDWKEEWREAFETASPEDIQAVRDLPGFDYDVFEEITGLDLRTKETEERRSHQMAVRMKPSTGSLIKSLADSEGVPIVEIFESAIAFYAKNAK